MSLPRQIPCRSAYCRRTARTPSASSCARRSAVVWCSPGCTSVLISLSLRFGGGLLLEPLRLAPRRLAPLRPLAAAGRERERTGVDDRGAPVDADHRAVDVGGAGGQQPGDRARGLGGGAGR